MHYRGEILKEEGNVTYVYFGNYETSGGQEEHGFFEGTLTIAEE